MSECDFQPAECQRREREMVSLYFAKPNRRYTLELIDTYAKEVTKRVLPVFDHIEKEADDAANQCWCDTGDDSTPYERGFSVYSDLKFVRDQVTGLAIAGIYHLWERLLKNVLVRQYRHYDIPTKEDVFKANFPKLENFLQDVGWSIKAEAFYSDLDCLRLVANVVKHGDGDACKRLRDKAPDMFFDFGLPWMNDF